MSELDQIQMQFNPTALGFLNAILGFILFGVSLDLKPEDFTRLFKMPKPVLVGLIGHTFILPLITYLLILLIHPAPSLALGMVLIAACPGGHMANFMTKLSKGNTALSITISSVSTLIAAFFTPFNFSFWSGRVPYLQDLVRKFHLSFLDMVSTLLVLVVIPLLLGLYMSVKHPATAEKIQRPIKMFSLVFFFSFLIYGIVSNVHLFKGKAYIAFLLVVLHNAIALASGYLLGKIFKLDNADAKTLSFEVGIQNVGLGLVLIFSFFNGLGGMALMASIWGVWHILSGFGLSYYFSKK